MAGTQQPTPEVAERYRRVVQLRSVGLTFDDIASRVGYESRQAAHHAYKAALKWWGRPAVDEAQQLEDERLDLLWRTALERLDTARQRQEVDTDEILRVANTLLNISKRRSGLLGLDAPRQVELAGVGGGALQTDVGELLRERIFAVQDTQTPSTNGQHILNGHQDDNGESAISD
jgi:hypothetical protein